MPWPFRNREEVAREAFASVALAHAQELIAWSQAAMETWNDGVVASSTDYDPGDEVFVRGTFSTASGGTAANDSLLAAARRQLRVVGHMQAENDGWVARYREAALVDSVAVMSDSIASWLYAYEAKVKARVRMVAERDNPDEASIEFSNLDATEFDAMVETNASILTLRSESRLSDSQWLGLSCDAINRVRRCLGLAGFSTSQLASLQRLGLSGQRPRFFEGGDFELIPNH